MSIKTAAPAKSNIIAVHQFAVVIELVDGEQVVSMHGQISPGISLASLIAPIKPGLAAPIKTVQTETVTPPAPAVKTAPAPAPVANGLCKATKKDGGACTAKATSTGLCMAHSKKPQADKPAPAPQQTTEKPKPSGGGGGGKVGGGRPMKKERHQIAESGGKARIWNKLKTKVLEVWVVKEIKTPKFEGFLVLNPDRENGIDTEKGYLYGAVWAVPSDSLIEWID